MTERATIFTPHVFALPVCPPVMAPKQNIFRAPLIEATRRTATNGTWKVLGSQRTVVEADDV